MNWCHVQVTFPPGVFELIKRPDRISSSHFFKCHNLIILYQPPFFAVYLNSNGLVAWPGGYSFGEMDVRNSDRESRITLSAWANFSVNENFTSGSWYHQRLVWYHRKNFHNPAPPALHMLVKKTPLKIYMKAMILRKKKEFLKSLKLTSSTTLRTKEWVGENWSFVVICGRCNKFSRPPLIDPISIGTTQTTPD